MSNMIGADIVDPDERCVESIFDAVGRIGSIALHEAVAPRPPFSENIHAVVELRRPNFRKETRFQVVADEGLAGRDNGFLRGFRGFCRSAAS